MFFKFVVKSNKNRTSEYPNKIHGTRLTSINLVLREQCISPQIFTVYLPPNFYVSGVTAKKLRVKTMKSFGLGLNLDSATNKP